MQKLTAFEQMHNLNASDTVFAWAYFFCDPIYQLLFWQPLIRFSCSFYQHFLIIDFEEAIFMSLESKIEDNSRLSSTHGDAVAVFVD
mgnify:CR=1 FL=1